MHAAAVESSQKWAAEDEKCCCIFIYWIWVWNRIWPNALGTRLLYEDDRKFIHLFNPLNDQVFLATFLSPTIFRMMTVISSSYFSHFWWSTNCGPWSWKTYGNNKMGIFLNQIWNYAAGASGSKLQGCARNGALGHMGPACICTGREESDFCLCVLPS